MGIFCFHEIVTSRQTTSAEKIALTKNELKKETKGM